MYSVKGSMFIGIPWTGVQCTLNMNLNFVWRVLTDMLTYEMKNTHNKAANISEKR